MGMPGQESPPRNCTAQQSPACPRPASLAPSQRSPSTLTALDLTTSSTEPMLLSVRPSTRPLLVPPFLLLLVAFAFTHPPSPPFSGRVCVHMCVRARVYVLVVDLCGCVHVRVGVHMCVLMYTSVFVHVPEAHVSPLPGPCAGCPPSPSAAAVGTCKQIHHKSRLTHPSLHAYTTHACIRKHVHTPSPTYLPTYQPTSTHTHTHTHTHTPSAPFFPDWRIHA